MVTDAPAHQSKLIIQYVQGTFNRSVTHLLVSSRLLKRQARLLNSAFSRWLITIVSLLSITAGPTWLMTDDHNYGASDYVAIGAKLVVPEQFTYYWDNIPNVQFATATQVFLSPSFRRRRSWYTTFQRDPTIYPQRLRPPGPWCLARGQRSQRRLDVFHLHRSLSRSLWPDGCRYGRCVEPGDLPMGLWTNACGAVVGYC